MFAMFQYPNKNVSIIFCGDFNSTPDCGIFKFMTQGSVSQDVSDWESSEFFTYLLPPV